MSATIIIARRRARPSGPAASAAVTAIAGRHGWRDFTSYEFGPERPAQLIVGDGVNTLLPLAKAPLIGSEIDGIRVRVLERTAAGWDGTLYDINDVVLARCKLGGRALECQ